MSRKVLTEILVPAIGVKFDVYIPLAIRTGDAVRMISSVLSDLSNDKFIATEDSVLCDAETGIIYSVNTEVAELNLKNGSRLLLI